MYKMEWLTLVSYNNHLYPFHTYARMLRIAADALSVAIRSGSVLYAYCIRNVSVDFRCDPPRSATQFGKWFHVSRMLRMLRIMSVGTDSVFCPYCLHRHPYSVRGVRTLHPSLSAAIRGKFGIICLIFCRQFMHELLIPSIHWSSEQPLSDPLACVLCRLVLRLASLLLLSSFRLLCSSSSSKWSVAAAICIATAETVA